MVQKQKFTVQQLKAQEQRNKQAKKLNNARRIGIIYDVTRLDENEEYITVAENVMTDYLMNAINDGLTGMMYSNCEYMCIVCPKLAFELLKPIFNTAWAHEPTYNCYVFYFAYNELKLKQLEEILQGYYIRVLYKYFLSFDKRLFKYCNDWSSYRFDKLPSITDSQIKHCKKINKLLEDNNGFYFQINKHTETYRMAQAICGKLGKTVMSLNSHITLEALLSLSSISSAILVNENLEQSYRFDLKTLLKTLKYAGKSVAKIDTLKGTLSDLVSTGFIDSFDIDDIYITFKSELITKHIRQQIKRPIGYYAGMPANKPYVATFVDYLWWITRAKHKKITIALDTLLENLGLEHLIKQSRLTIIANVLSTLRKYGIKYNLLLDNQESQPITSKEVKYLLNNRQELYKFITLSPSEDGKEL